ncbi:MAG: hypothetical protein Q8Q49_01995 [bacterium]|nr:hypothetical protein [bacterium]
MTEVSQPPGGIKREPASVVRPPGFIESGDLPLGERLHRKVSDWANRDPKEPLTRREVLKRTGDAVAVGGLAILGLDVAILGPERIVRGARRRILGKPSHLPEASQVSETIVPVDAKTLMLSQDAADFSELTKMPDTRFVKKNEEGFWVDTKTPRLALVQHKAQPLYLARNGINIELGAKIDPLTDTFVPQDEIKDKMGEYGTYVRIRGDAYDLVGEEGETSDIWFARVSGKEVNGTIQPYFSDYQQQPVSEAPVCIAVNFGKEVPVSSLDIPDDVEE